MFCKGTGHDIEQIVTYVIINTIIGIMRLNRYKKVYYLYDLT